MSSGEVRFGTFVLDPANRRLSRGGRSIELNARYMDTLILLVSARGALVGKTRFMDEVWRGVPVTDEALTQAIRTLRRTLGDSAGTPTFIETVPKHGYRFIAPVEPTSDAAAEPVAWTPSTRTDFIETSLAGARGAVIAGAAIGLLYGLLAVPQQAVGIGGALSLLLVLMLVSMLSAGVAGAGIAAGLAVADLIRPARCHWLVAGGALGGMALGAFAKLLGKDAFRLLLGRTVEHFAGAFEGILLGAAVGFSACLARRGTSNAVGWAALLGALAGTAVFLLGGSLMAGSLQGLAEAFPASQLRPGALFFAAGPPRLGQTLAAATEGAIFSAGLTWGLGRRWTGPTPSPVDTRTPSS